MIFSYIPGTMRERGKADHPSADDDKLVVHSRPLFPKMHVNDRDQAGGPKPPPRNKMALFEQPAAPAPAASINTSHGITISTAQPNKPPLLQLPPPKYSGISPSGSSIYCVSGGQVPAAAERLPIYAQYAAAIANTSTLPLLPFPVSDGQVGLPPECKIITQEKMPAQVSSGGKVDDDKYPELLIFQQKQQGPVDNSIEGTYPQRYATQANASRIRSSMEWQLKQSNHSEVMGSGSSMKSACNVEQVGTEICLLKAPPLNDIRGPDEVSTSSNKPSKDCEYRLPELQPACNMKDSRLKICPTEYPSIVNVLRPENVVVIIGEEEFLRLRNEMIKHQKQFAEQVFELHRLIAVQRLIARSGKALVEDRQKLEKPSSSRMLNPKEKQNGHNHERQYDTSRTKSSSEGVREMFYIPPQRIDPFKVPPITSRANQETSAGNIKPANAGGINTPWICPPPGTANHWLVPVISPSEGLIYKPYPIPSAPNPAGFMPPPIHINPTKAPHTYPIPCQQSGIRPFPDISPCFDPYVTPSLNTVASASAFEHISKANSYHHPNIKLPGSSFKSSWNFSTLVSGTVSSNIDATQQAKHGGDSTASSSPPGGARGNILPLFPEEPTAIAMQNKYHQAQSSEQQQRKVIKAVPHHPTSPTESAARIIRYIREERN